ncbi:hypothetical protein B0H13DRAFT_1872926 [Mycena leptocephala]|nr:hypothetical protein B0H13DRAFT_1872926 [Mycena leptocephala]
MSLQSDLPLPAINIGAPSTLACSHPREARSVLLQVLAVAKPQTHRWRSRSTSTLFLASPLLLLIPPAINPQPHYTRPRRNYGKVAPSSHLPIPELIHVHSGRTWIGHWQRLSPYPFSMESNPVDDHILARFVRIRLTPIATAVFTIVQHISRCPYPCLTTRPASMPSMRSSLPMVAVPMYISVVADLEGWYAYEYN